MVSICTFMDVLAHLKWLFGHCSWCRRSKGSERNKNNSSYFPLLRLSYPSKIYSASLRGVLTRIVWWWIDEAHGKRSVKAGGNVIGAVDVSCGTEIKKKMGYLWVISKENTFNLASTEEYFSTLSFQKHWLTQTSPCSTEHTRPIYILLAVWTIKNENTWDAFAHRSCLFFALIVSIYFAVLFNMLWYLLTGSFFPISVSLLQKFYFHMTKSQLRFGGSAARTVSDATVCPQNHALFLIRTLNLMWTLILMWNTLFAFASKYIHSHLFGFKIPYFPQTQTLLS